MENQILNEVYFGGNKFTYASDKLFDILLSKRKIVKSIDNLDKVTKYIQEIEDIYSEFVNRKVVFYFENAGPHEFNCYTYSNEITRKSNIKVEKNRLMFTGIDKEIIVVFTFAILFQNNFMQGKHLTAILLHELGHSFEQTLPILSSIKYCKSLTSLATSAALKSSGNKKDVNKDEVKDFIFYKNLMMKGFSSVYSGFGSFISRCFSFFVPNNMKKMYIGEKFADSVASMYGYGPQLAEALKLMEERDSKLESGFVLRLFYTVILYTALLFDEHPGTGVRMRQEMLYLKYEIEHNNYPEPIKKELNKQLKELEILNKQYYSLLEKESVKDTFAEYCIKYSKLMTSLFKEGDLLSTIMSEDEFSYELLDNRIKRMIKRGKNNGK